MQHFLACVYCRSHTIVSHILTCKVDGSPVVFGELIGSIIADSQPSVIEAQFNQTSYGIVHCAIANVGSVNVRVDQSGTPLLTF